MIDYARSEGGGYHYDTMREDARKFTGRLKYQGQIERLNPETPIPRGWMVETRLNQDVKYRVHGYATIVDPDTGLPVEIPASFYTDDAGSDIEHHKAFMDYYSSRYEEEDIELLSFRTRAVEHHAGYSY